MATVIAELYDALKAAGAPEDQARKAAEVVTGYENRFGELRERMTALEAKTTCSSGWLASILPAL